MRINAKIRPSPNCLIPINPDPYDFIDNEDGDISENSHCVNGKYMNN